MAASWGYSEENGDTNRNLEGFSYIFVTGPEQWHKWYPIAETGARQSPIDIKTSQCRRGEALKPLKIEYSPLSGQEIF